MPINRGPFNALVDDDGSNTVGTVWNKSQIQAVILDPVDAAIIAAVPVVTPGQVTFPAVQNPSSDPNVLDDYEEAVWTPSISASGGASGQAYTTREGRYIKMGRIVMAQAFIVLSNKGTLTGGLLCTGLPFAAAGNLTFPGTAAVVWLSLATTWVSVVGYVQGGGTSIFITGTQTAGLSNNNVLTTADLTNTSGFILSIMYQAGA